MAVHNEESYLRASLNSILQQSLRDLEFVIVDDGSTDGSAALLRDFARDDSRIRLLVNERNCGLTHSLNVGMEAVRGAFVARMDADDVALPGRLAAQLAVFRRSPDIVLCGTNTIVIDAAGKRVAVGEWPEDPEVLRWYALFRPAVAHPTAMFPARLVSDGLRYDDTLPTAQDYELWSRLLQRGAATVIQEPRLLYRQHRRSISVARRAEQAETAAGICRRNLLRQFPQALSRQESGQAAALAGFLYGTTFAGEAAEMVGTLVDLEQAYLDSLGKPARRVRRAVRRLTVRWIVQALLTNRTLGVRRRMRAVGPLSGRIGVLLAEGGSFLKRRFRARIA